MEKGEYWLLDSVVEAWYPLASLASEDVEQAFNRRHHGLARPELLGTLERLFGRGDLLAERMRKSVPEERFTPDRAQIEEALAGRLDISYGLTSRGGARWESVSRPEWQRYISACVFAEPQEGEIVGCDRGLVEKYYSLSHYAWNISAVAGSERWDVREPWQATYWKELPSAHRVRFSFEWVPPGPAEEVSPQVREWFAWTNRWYTPHAGPPGTLGGEEP